MHAPVLYAFALMGMASDDAVLQFYCIWVVPADVGGERLITRTLVQNTTAIPANDRWGHTWYCYRAGHKRTHEEVKAEYDEVMRMQGLFQHVSLETFSCTLNHAGVVEIQDVQ